MVVDAAVDFAGVNKLEPPPPPKGEGAGAGAVVVVPPPAALKRDPPNDDEAGKPPVVLGAGAGVNPYREKEEEIRWRGWLW